MQQVHTEVARRPPPHQGVGSLTWCDSTSYAVFDYSAHDAAAVLRIWRATLARWLIFCGGARDKCLVGTSSGGEFAFDSG